MPVVRVGPDLPSAAEAEVIAAVSPPGGGGAVSTIRGGCGRFNTRRAAAAQCLAQCLANLTAIQGERGQTHSCGGWGGSCLRTHPVVQPLVKVLPVAACSGEGGFSVSGSCADALWRVPTVVPMIPGGLLQRTRVVRVLPRPVHLRPHLHCHKGTVWVQFGYILTIAPIPQHRPIWSLRSAMLS